MLHTIYQQIWKTQKWPQDWERSVFIPIPKKGNVKGCSDYHTIVLISHVSKIMLKNNDKLYFLGSKITVDSDYSHKIKRRLLLGRKAMTNLHSILKSRDIILPIKVCIVKAMVFPVVMYRCASWTIKKAECWRTDAFKPWCCRRLLRVPWTARRSNQ